MRKKLLLPGLLKRIFFVALFSFILAKAFTQTQTFNLNGTFVVPAGVTSLKVEAWGGGGEGSNSGNKNRAGGGGGAYASSTLAVTGGSSHPVTVGLGGTSATSATASNFNNLLIAAPGAGGNGTSGGAGGSMAASTGSNKFAGGNGANASGNNSQGGGGGGGSAFAGSVGISGTTSNTNIGGVGGAGFGNGGTGGFYGGISAQSGFAVGGGGGGAADGQSISGNGANGRIDLTYICPTYSLSGVIAASICINGLSTITLNASSIGLPTGNYMVTYNLSAPNAVTGATANFSVSTAGVGSFTLPALSNSGTTVITITSLSSGSCNSVIIINNTANIVVNPNATITLSGGSNTQTTCINTSIASVNYTTGNGATGAAFSGLPAGVSGSWAANVVTISGTPTLSGIFNYTIALVGGCGSVNTTGSITVTANNTVGIASSSPTLCINTALAGITHTTTGATGIGTPAGLPTGITATFASNTITIAGTPSVSGTFNYSIPLIGGCGSVNAVGTITVTANKTVSAASSTPTLCISTPLINITHTTTGATGIGAPTGLPAGTSAAFGSNTITISGTPTASGSFNYSIPLTGGCGTVNATGTIAVTANNTISVASSSPTLCINTVLTNITHTTVGATGIGTATGLPTGISAAFGSNTITISGTPGVSGTFNYSIPLTGGCGIVNATGTIIVTANNTVSVGSSTPTLCINTSLTNITHTTSGATGIGSPTGLPTGINANFSANTITISGTPGVSGTFNYSIPLTGGCGIVNAAGTISVTANKTVSAASSTPTLCINTPLINITHTTTGATGIGTPTGLPTGISAAFASNTITISGTPSVSGTFNYSISLIGGCGVANAAGTIIVAANNTVSAASSSPTLCINTALTNITHTTTGATGIGAPTGLPAGVIAGFAPNTITISGTPTVSGTFNYSIPLTGGCGSVSAVGTITVTADKTVSAASSTPTLCISTPLVNITHTTTGATGIGAPTGLPAGTSPAFASNTITISGTPTASGTFNYSIPLVGGCGSANALGTITVTANKTVSAASSTPTLCINTVLTNITHTTVGATGIGAPSGLPAGISAAFASNTITLSGTATASGIFNYSIPLTGGCGNVNAIGTITVSPNNTIALSSAAGTENQTRCVGSAITPITYNTTGATGANFSVLPPGLFAVFSSNVLTISGTPTASGPYSYTVTLTGGCGIISRNITMNIDPATVAGTLSSSQTICSGDVPATLVLTGETGSVVKWERSTSIGFPNGTSTSDINVTSTSLAGATIGPLTATTYFRVYVKSGLCAEISSNIIAVTVNVLPTVYNITGTNTCQGLSTGTVELSSSQTGITYQLLDASGNVIQTSKAGTGGLLTWTTIAANTYKIRATNNTTSCVSFTSNYIVASNSAPASPTISPSSVIICQGVPGTLLTASGFYPNVLIQENFSNGNAAGWQQSNSTSNNTGLQSLNNSQNAGGTIDFAILNSPSVYTFGAVNYTFQSPDNSKFLMTNHKAQDVNTYTTTTLYSPAISTQGMVSATVSFSHTLKLNSRGADPVFPDNALIQVSTTGAAGSWNTIKEYTSATGLEIGATNNFVAESVLLPNTYLNQNNVYVRFVYNSKYQGWWWALDDILLSVAPQVNFTWSPSTGLYTDALSTSSYSGGTTATVYAMPNTTTTYIVTTNILSANGCPANNNVTVSVNTAPAITVQPTASAICLGSNFVLTASSTGIGSSQQWEVSADGGSTWSLANGTGYMTSTNSTVSTLTVINPAITMIDYQYRLSANAGAPCTVSVKSNAYKLKIRNVWLGTINTDWQNGANWSDGVVTGILCDTVHILSRLNNPVLSSGNASIKNLLIYSGANVTIANQPSTWLAVSASIINKNPTPAINALNGRLILNGTTGSQKIGGSLFTQHTLNYLTLSNSSGGVSLSGTPNADTLYISHHLNFGNVNGTIFTTNSNLTLMSRGVNATANIGDLTNGGANTLNRIDGQVTVERWINARKAWRFLSIPTVSTQTLRTSWQENNSANSNALHPGFGTTVTNLTAADPWLALGFDTYSLQGPSVKYFNPDFVTFTGISNTLSAPINTSRGYMTFIRGNRSAITFSDPPSETILRTSGILKQGNINIPVLANSFTDMGNPYASSLDMRKINLSNTQAFFYLWNPNMGGASGLGAYQTYSFNGTNYVPTPYLGPGQENIIQSGQAFLVRGGSSNGSLTFEENDKDSINNMPFRITGRSEFLRAGLHTVVNNITTLADGAMIEYGANWSNAVNTDDALKMTNLAENVACFRENKLLVVERRKTIVASDTIFLRLSGLRLQNYQWLFSFNNMDSVGRSAFLIDSYLGTKTLMPLNADMVYNFSVQNIAGSYASDRFMIVFKQSPPRIPPAPFLVASITATRNTKGSAAIKWSVEHESNVNGYTIERSADGAAFTELTTRDPFLNNGATANYHVDDLIPLQGDNFYRVKALFKNGSVVYSGKAKLDSKYSGSGITVFPNPVVQRIMHLHFTGQVRGLYQLILINSLQQVVHQTVIEIKSQISSVEVRFRSFIPPGAYQLKITSPSGEITGQQVIVE